MVVGDKGILLRAKGIFSGNEKDVTKGTRKDASQCKVGDEGAKNISEGKWFQGGNKWRQDLNQSTSANNKNSPER